MYYDRSINFHAILGLWDTETFELLNRIFVDGGLLSKNSTVADVGANIGYYTMWLSTVMAGSGHVYAFEPSLDVLKFLSNNLKINNIGNADVVRMACGDHVGNADFFIAKHHHASSLHADWAGGGQGDARKITERIGPYGRKSSQKMQVVAETHTISLARHAAIRCCESDAGGEQARHDTDISSTNRERNHFAWDDQT
jgi:FkbM family methyltransferase